MEMLITGMVIGVMIGVMFALIVKKDEYLGLSVPHTDAEFEAICKDNLRLMKLNNELQIRLAEKNTGLYLSMPYDRKETDNA